jgi:1-acyl-sn-glycerol-3-phosphate acyltransferase
LLYRLFKLPAKLALYFYCRKIFINKKELLQSEGPLLIAANHPNSFLDAIILATLFKQPIHSLARGDAFANNFYKKLLFSFNMLPVYRLSEGAENLEHNYTTFSACLDIFKKKGIVLMFSEGRCINEWHLRPLKKGTARLAISAWEQNIPLKVLPLGINYSSFRLFGKNVILNFGEIITENEINNNLPQGNVLASFNILLEEQLKKLVIEADRSEKEKIKRIFFVRQSMIKTILLFLPAVIGYIIHLPLYYAAVLAIKKRANDHYDSIIVAILFIFYPLFLLLLTIVFFLFTKNVFSLGLLLLLPFTAWSYLQLKKQTA